MGGAKELPMIMADVNEGKSCVRACIRTCVRAYIHSCVRTYMRACVRVVCICTYMRSCGGGVHTHVYVHVFACV